MRSFRIRRRTTALLTLGAAAALAFPGCNSTRSSLRVHISPSEEITLAASLLPGSPPRARAIARALTKLAQNPRDETPPIRVRWHGRPGTDTLQGDAFIAASSVRRRGWKWPWHAQAGEGTPLVSVRASKDQRFVGKLGTTLGTTAVLAPRDNSYEIVLHDSPARSGLAHDTTAPLAHLVQGHKLMPALKAVFNTGKYLDALGLYRISPYDPDKVPLVLVHGLKSTPEVWTAMLNALAANEAIRSRYQFWLYSYPTGSPILYSSMRLRNELNAMRAHYDPEGLNPNLDRMVVVGHSMGGILTRMMVSASNEKLLAVTAGPIDDLDLEPQAKAMVRQALIFEPQGYIARAVFLAAPHRGSDVAEKPIVHWLSTLIRLPVDLTKTMLAVLPMPLRGDATAAKNDKVTLPNGLEDLDPDSMFMRSMADQPISPHIPYHSIIAIGEDGDKKPLAEADDSLVLYPSAHLDGAQSEITIAASHNIYDHPQAIAEVTRILLLELRDR